MLSSSALNGRGVYLGEYHIDTNPKICPVAMGKGGVLGVQTPPEIK